MTQEFPPRFTCEFGRNHGSYTGYGSSKVQMPRNKIVLPVFFIPPHYQSCPKMGPIWTVTVHFFIHWVSVLHHHCGSFQVLGKVGFLWEESLSFLIDKKWEKALQLWGVVSLQYECALWLLQKQARPCLLTSQVSNLTQTVARETDRLQSWGQSNSLLTLRLWKPFLKLSLFVINTVSDRDTV